MMQLDVAAADTQTFVGLIRSAPLWVADRCQEAAEYSVPISSHVYLPRDGHSLSRCMRAPWQHPRGKHRAKSPK